MANLIILSINTDVLKREQHQSSFHFCLSLKYKSDRVKEWCTSGRVTMIYWILPLNELLSYYICICVCVCVTDDNHANEQRKKTDIFSCRTFYLYLAQHFHLSCGFFRHFFFSTICSHYAESSGVFKVRQTFPLIDQWIGGYVNRYTLIEWIENGRRTKDLLVLMVMWLWTTNSSKHFDFRST